MEEQQKGLAFRGQGQEIIQVGGLVAVLIETFQAKPQVGVTSDEY